MSDFTVDLKTGAHRIINNQAENWQVTLVDTGLNTLTGGRLKRVASYINNETFCMTYGDGLSDLDIKKEIAFHHQHGKIATVAAVQPPGRFGVLNLEVNGRVYSFEEKPRDEIGWINGGFFVLEPQAFAYVNGDDTSWEREPLSNMAQDGQLMAYQHNGFWLPCDTLRDKRELEALWASGNAPWRCWDTL
jgi:glucose-1-phosphate cytidylyltransferase